MKTTWNHEPANFAILENSDRRVVIEDLGPWDKFMTVTNAAESVVAALVKSGELRTGQRLFYIDSSGDFDEIIVSDGRFAGFRPARGEVRP